MSPITGISPDLFRVHTASELNVYQVKQNAPATLGHRNLARLGKQNGAAGKGETDIQARVSCLAEAVERYSCTHRGDEPRIKSKIENLGESAVHPKELLNFSERQYAARDEWNRKHPGFNWVPQRFDESREIEWSPNWSLTQNTVKWLPTSYCYFVYESRTSPAVCRGDSNGCASGNNLEEAILQGFLELVERDSMALFWYNRVQRPSINLESFNHPFFDRMAAYYSGKGRTLVTVDITSDLGIPAVAAFSWKRSGGNILIGLGAHLDARIAISRAIGELNQMEPVAELWSDSSRDESLHPLDDRHITEWLETATVENQPYLVPSCQSPREACDFKRMDSRDLLDDINTCVEIVRQKGMEFLILDLTRSDVGFPTVRVTVPGLRHFWARLAPGRLYDVPVNLGWIPMKNDETELNPIPFFL